ncbi:MAG TPA: amino acid aminotransferase [Alphaproteobacteria bacterium]|nr:amino acid aminotransferase [Alphaproteobacteria bacterium]
MFESLEVAPPDGILAVIAAYRADPRPQKIDLGVGVYRDSAGRTPVLAAVREAERRLFDAQDTKTYVGMAGDVGFNAAMTRLVFAESAPADRIRAVQTPGGSGALRVLAELLRRAKPGATVWVSDPTWPNHEPIVRAAGLQTRSYPYLDRATKTVRVEAMLAALAEAGPNDIVLLHGCCHNPSGADLAPADWDAVAELAVKRGFLPFVDLAYQGFGEGLDADAYGMRRLAAAVPEMVVAVSCSKNFGLYRERVGAAFVLAANPAQADLAQGQLLGVVRANYSMPPDHGAATVRIILEDAALRAQWEAELDGMRDRMLGLRRSLADSLRRRSNGDAFDYIARHRGMFSLLGTSEEQTRRLREEHAVYVVGGGRINIAGLGEADVDRFADALLAVGLQG